MNRHCAGGNNVQAYTGHAWVMACVWTCVHTYVCLVYVGGGGGGDRKEMIPIFLSCPRGKEGGEQGKRWEEGGMVGGKGGRKQVSLHITTHHCPP